MKLKEIERVVASIEANLFKNSNSYALGMLKSHFRGAGLQFKEHQVYNPGDDVRFIDWKLSAKQQNTYIKTFEEERNVEIVVFIDITQAMVIGYKDVSKLQAAIELTCLLYLLVEKSKDKVKLVMAYDDIITLPTKSGHEGIALLVSILSKKELINEDGKIAKELKLDCSVSEDKKIKLIKSFLARGKDVVILSDMNTYSQIQSLEQILMHPKSHAFRLASPIEIGNTDGYFIPGHFNTKNRQYFSLVKRAKIDNQLKGRWKYLDVSKRYLEEFVREML